MDETAKLLQQQHDGGFIVVELGAPKTEGELAGERIEQPPEMSPAAIILGTMVGNDKASEACARMEANGHMTLASGYFICAVVVGIVEGATGKVDLNAWGWFMDISLIYLAGASGRGWKKCKDLGSLAHQTDRLRGQVTRLSEEVDRLSPEVDRLGGENDRYTGLLAQHAAMQTEMQSLLTSLQGRHEELAADAEEIDNAVEGLTQLKSQFDAVLPKLDNLVNGLKGQVNELTGQVDALTGQVDELESQVDELGTKIAALDKTREGLQTSVSLLSQLQGEADVQGAFDEKVNQRSGELVEEQRALQEKREKLQAEQEGLLEKERGLVEQLQEHANRLSSLDGLETRLAEGKKSEFALTRQLTALRKQRDEAKGAAKAQTAALLNERSAAVELLKRAVPVEEADGATAKVEVVVSRQLSSAAGGDEVVTSTA